MALRYSTPSWVRAVSRAVWWASSVASQAAVICSWLDPHLARRGHGGLLEGGEVRIAAGPIGGTADRRLGVEGDGGQAGDAWRVGIAGDLGGRLGGGAELLARPAHDEGGDAEADDETPQPDVAGAAEQSGRRLVECMSVLSLVLWSLPPPIRRGATSQGNEVSNLTTSD